MRAVFLRKENEIEADEFEIEKVIVLPKKYYEFFTENLMDVYDFIIDNCELMCKEKGVRHCILVTGEGVDEGVLVESEGAHYARYSAFVPNITGLIQQMEETDKIDKTRIDPKENGQMMMS